ncbi:MAG: ExbD/TolR family protein [Planctomycetota bacterium]
MFQAGRIGLLSVAAAAAVLAACSRQPLKSGHERTIDAARDGGEGDGGSINTGVEGGVGINIDDLRLVDPGPDAVPKEAGDLRRENVFVVAAYPGDVIMVDGERVSPEALNGILKEWAERSPRGADGLPTAEVRIVGHSEAHYKTIQRVMVACMKAYIWKLSFGPLEEEPEEDGTEE